MENRASEKAKTPRGKRFDSPDRCARCRLREVLCLCDRVPSLHVATRVIVLMHWRETHTTTNTAHLAARALPGTEVRVRGWREAPMSTEGFRDPSRKTLLLFPTDDAQELGPGFLSAHPGPHTLVVPDGSWRQAQKVSHREPELAHAIRVKLPPGPPSRYRLRRESCPENVCTFEAIARALGALEQQGARVQGELEELFELMIERVLWSRGDIPTAECRFPVPPAAIEEFHQAGIRGGIASGRPPKR